MWRIFVKRAATPSAREAMRAGVRSIAFTIIATAAVTFFRLCGPFTLESLRFLASLFRLTPRRAVPSSALRSTLRQPDVRRSAKRLFSYTPTARRQQWRPLREHIPGTYAIPFAMQPPQAAGSKMSSWCSARNSLPQCFHIQNRLLHASTPRRGDQPNEQEFTISAVHVTSAIDL